MAGIEHVYQIADAAKELRKKIHKDLEVKKMKDISAGEIAGWLDKTLEMQEASARKLDELFERLVRLEDETRKSRARSEMLQKPKK